LGLEKPDIHRAPVSALTIGGSYVVGGLIPLLPYVFIPNSKDALYVSAAVTLCALFGFGAGKGRAMGVSWLKSAVQTFLIGGVAAAVAFVLARLVTGA